VPIRVICPFCGRSGRAPDEAIGRNVKCPACSRRYVVTADVLLPDDATANDENPRPRPQAPAPRTRPQAESSPAPSAKPKAQRGAGSGDDCYDLDEAYVAPPPLALKPKPLVPDPDDSDDDDRPGGLNLPVPLLVGGGLGLALLSMLMVWAAVSMFRGGATEGEVAAPSDPVLQRPATKVAAASTPAPAPTATPELATAASKIGETPDEAPAVVSVAALIRTSDEPAAAPEPAGESDVAAKARAGAALAAARDYGPGKTLSTADIVAESEPSVALVKGNVSSGTGFLVAPGLVATNAHVIDDEFVADLEIRFVSADEKHKAPLKAELLYEDPDRDLAFLAVKTDLKPLRVAKTYNFRKGEDITVIGNPGLGDGQVLENAINRGVMSTKARIDNQDFYQLGIAVNPGNSGGPVFDSSGRVIGVVTLKSSKQEATSFSIPIEDVQAALGKLPRQPASEADRCRSRHRINTAVKGLGSGGALMCLIIDLRRAEKLSNNPAITELLAKLEPVTAELDKEMFGSLAVQAPRITKDPLVASTVKAKVGDMSDNFARIRGAYSSGKNVDDNQLRPWKQTHKRLITELSAALKLEFPKDMLLAFDDHAPSQPTIITLGPQNLGSYSSRLRQRPPIGGIPRPPSLRDRIGPRRGVR
jgi:S1-C subfamily serine protease